LYQLPNYVSITYGILASNDTMIVNTITITYNNDYAKGTVSGATTRSGGVGLSTNG
jgi:hypothetical protein